MMRSMLFSSMSHRRTALDSWRSLRSYIKAQFWLALLIVSIPTTYAQADTATTGMDTQEVEALSPALLRPTLDRPLKVALSEFPPYAYLDDNGEIQGKVVAVFRRVFDELEWPYRMSFTPMARIHHQLRLGAIDIWAGPLGVPVLEEHVFEVALPDTYGMHLYLWRRPGTPAVNDVLKLRGKTLAVVNGLTYRGLIERITDPANGINVFRASSHDSAFKMLIGNRTEYLLGYEQPMRQSMNQLPDIKLLRHSLQTRQVGFIVSRKAPQSDEIYNALKQACGPIC